MICESVFLSERLLVLQVAKGEKEESLLSEKEANEKMLANITKE